MYASPYNPNPVEVNVNKKEIVQIVRDARAIIDAAGTRGIAASKLREELGFKDNQEDNAKFSSVSVVILADKSKYTRKKNKYYKVTTKK